MVKRTQTIRQDQLTNCLSVVKHFVGLAFEEFNDNNMLRLKTFTHKYTFNKKVWQLN